jgi:CRP-like cAMP-binding protein
MDNEFANIEHIERWPAGEVMFREGEQPRGVFILYSGSVDLEFSARNGAKKALRTAIPPEIVGLSDAISNTPHTCTATIQTNSKIGFVSIGELRRQLDESPALWLTIAKYLSADVESCWAEMRTLAVAR